MESLILGKAFFGGKGDRVRQVEESREDRRRERGLGAGLQQGLLFPCSRLAHKSERGLGRACLDDGGCSHIMYPQSTCVLEQFLSTHSGHLRRQLASLGRILKPCRRLDPTLLGPNLHGQVSPPSPVHVNKHGVWKRKRPQSSSSRRKPGLRDRCRRKQGLRAASRGCMPGTCEQPPWTFPSTSAFPMVFEILVYGQLARN